MRYSAGLPVNFFIVFLLESVFVCAVDGFMIISGYFMSSSDERTLWKPFKLLVQVILFNIGIYIFRVLCGRADFSIKHMARLLLPANYFVVLYCVVYILSPYMNLVIDILKNKNLKRMILLSVISLSVYPTMVDALGGLSGKDLTGLNSIGMWGDQSGYTFVNFMLCWMLGACLRKMNVRAAKWKSICCYIGFTAFIFLYAQIMLKFDATPETSFSYCSPIIIGAAVSIFLFFKELNFGHIKFVNSLSEESFSVYLLHGFFIPHLGIEQASVSNPFLLLVHIMVSSMGIYIFCWCAGKIYHIIEGRFFGVLQKKITLPAIGIAEPKQ